MLTGRLLVLLGDESLRGESLLKVLNLRVQRGRLLAVRLVDGPHILLVPSLTGHNLVSMI